MRVLGCKDRPHEARHQLRLRATRRAHTGAARARKSRAAPEATLSGARFGPSSSNDSEEIMPRRFIWPCVLVALALGSMSCSSTPRRPAEFMMPSSEFTWERGERLRQSGVTMDVQGQRLEREGQGLRDQADQLEAQGRSLIDSAGRLRADGDRLGSEGAALRERGREALDLGSDAIEAVRKLEEAERLRREGEELREKTRR